MPMFSEKGGIVMGYVFKDGIQSPVNALVYDVIYAYEGGPPLSVLIKMRMNREDILKSKGKDSIQFLYSPPIMAPHHS